MKIRTFVIGSALALALLLFAQKRHSESVRPFAIHSVVDLTHSVQQADLSATEHAPHLVASSTEHHSLRQVSAADPTTIISAPADLTPGMWTVGQIPPERLIAPVVVLDVSANVARNSDYEVSVEDISAWEHVHGQIPMGAVVMVHTGWDSRWDSAKSYRNVDNRGTMHYPGFSEQAARFLVEGRNIMGLGIDTLSVDPGASRDFPVRRYTLTHSVYHLESVANLARVPANGAMVVVAPTKLGDSAAGPVRLFALVN